MSVSNPLLVSFQYLSLGLCMNDSDRFGFSGSALRGNALQTGRCSFIHAGITCVVVVVVLHLLGRKASCLLTDVVSREA